MTVADQAPVRVVDRAPWHQPSDPRVIYRSPDLTIAPYFLNYVSPDGIATGERFFDEAEARATAHLVIARYERDGLPMDAEGRVGA